MDKQQTQMYRRLIRRRDFVAMLGGTASAWPYVVRAQKTAVPVIGFLASASPEPWENRLRAFRRWLIEIGFEEGRNVAIEYRWAHGRNDRLPALAADLVQRQVDVIAANGPAAEAAKAATTTIPIVFFGGM